MFCENSLKLYKPKRRLYYQRYEEEINGGRKEEKHLSIIEDENGNLIFEVLTTERYDKCLVSVKVLDPEKLIKALKTYSSKKL